MFCQWHLHSRTFPSVSGCTPVRLFKPGACKLPSTVDNTLTLNKSSHNPNSNDPNYPLNMKLCHIPKFKHIQFIKQLVCTEKLQEGWVSLPSFIGDACPCSFRMSVNSSRAMRGLWTEEVSLGVQYSGYDRWYGVPAWLNLTVSLLTPEQGGFHMLCVCVRSQTCIWVDMFV